MEKPTGLKLKLARLTNAVDVAGGLGNTNIASLKRGGQKMLDEILLEAPTQLHGERIRLRLGDRVQYIPIGNVTSYEPE